MDDNQLEIYRENTKNNLWFSVFIIAVAILVPVFSIFFSYLRPANDTPAEWFQRSGAIVVVLALWVELHNNTIGVFLNSVGDDFTGYICILQKEFKARYVCIVRMGFIVAVLGSVIWGYGDVLYNQFT